MGVTRYVIIPDLAKIYDSNMSATKIVEAMKKAASYEYFITHPTLEMAKNPKEHIFKNRFSIAGILKIEVEHEDELSKDKLLKRFEDILALSSEEEKEIQLASLIKTVYVKGCELPFTDLQMKKREASQITSFRSNSDDETQLQLTQPPLLYLKRIPKELLFLLFTDHQFFLNFENWRYYNARESRGKGCVYDLFHATTTLCERLTTLSKTEVMTLEEIKGLQKILSESVYANLKGEDRRGIFREGYNSFPLHADAVTVAGIKELLQRIKSDKQAEGFRIGHFKRSNIVAFFCNTMSTMLRKEELGKTFPDTGEVTQEMLEKLRDLEKNAKAICAKKKGIPEETVETIVNGFLKDFTPHMNVDPSNYWVNLHYRYSDLSGTFSRNSPKAEHQYDLEYSREYAIASAGDVALSAGNIQDLSDNELDALARKIYEAIQSGEEISLLTPEPRLAEKWAREALEQYNRLIPHAQSVEETIRIIDNLVHELEILHLFHDVNCRTNYLLMNFLFLAHSIKWATEFNPNRLDAYGAEERLQQHKQAILRTDYIIEHQEQLVGYNAHVDLIYRANQSGLQTLAYSSKELSEVESDDQYQQISQQLVDKLDEYEKIFRETLISKIKKYDLQPTTSSAASTIFPIPKEYMVFADALKQFQVDYNARNFFERVAPFDSTIPEIAEDVAILKVLTGFNSNWSLSETHQAKPSFQSKSQT